MLPFTFIGIPPRITNGQRMSEIQRNFIISYNSYLFFGAQMVIPGMDAKRINPGFPDGSPIRSDNACPVNTKGYRQIRDTDVVDYLIIGSLEKGRINSHIRF